MGCRGKGRKGGNVGRLQGAGELLESRCGVSGAKVTTFLQEMLLGQSLPISPTSGMRDDTATEFADIKRKIGTSRNNFMPINSAT